MKLIVPGLHSELRNKISQVEGQNDHENNSFARS
jgi:hypothetical protein